MALLVPFCDLISLFSSISNNPEAEQALWDEIWGCVSYVKIPYETVMYNMPVYVRKYWIQRHNEANAPEKNSGSAVNTVDGASINTYAKMEQSNRKLGKKTP